MIIAILYTRKKYKKKKNQVQFVPIRTIGRRGVPTPQNIRGVAMEKSKNKIK